MLAFLRILSALALCALASSAPSKRGALGAAPHFVVYNDAWVPGQTGPPAAAALAGFNVLNLSFLMLSGAADQAQVWAQLSDSVRAKYKAEYESAGIALMVSAFGSTDAPTSAGADPVKTAQSMAAWVKQYDLDGIDVDYEDFDAVNGNMQNAANWLSTFTSTLRQELPAGQFLITHAPVAPWFSASDGVYAAVNKQVGDKIDWYNLQFYNQGTDEYTSCAGLLHQSSSAWPSTSVFELASAHDIPLDKLVIGKPGTTAAAANGFMSTSELAGCVQQAQQKGWTGGVMVWEFDQGNVDAAWIGAVRAAAWPVGSNPAPAPKPSTSSKAVPTPTPTSTKAAPTSTKAVPTTSSTDPVSAPESAPTTSSHAAHTHTHTSASTPLPVNPSSPSAPGAPAPSAPASNGCAGAVAWDASAVYWGATTVTYNGAAYESKWWTTGDVPDQSGEWGVWKPAACAGAPTNAKRMVRVHKRAHH